MTKHYYTGSQRLPTRVRNVLYYTPPDPTAQSSQGSTSLLLVEPGGVTRDHVLYDAYGGILTSTVPATLTGALAGQGTIP